MGQMTNLLVGGLHGRFHVADFVFTGPGDHDAVHSYAPVSSVLLEGIVPFLGVTDGRFQPFVFVRGNFLHFIFDRMF